MKVTLTYIFLFLFILSSSNSCTTFKRKENKKNLNLSEVPSWWNELNETWQLVFLREIDKIGEKPSKEDLLQILNLEKVNCDHFPLGETNLDPLRSLKRLKSVSAGSTFIQNIDALSYLDSLVYVNVPDNHISSIEPLRKHKDLEEVYAQMNNIESLEPLAEKQKLQVLVVFSNKIKTISPIMNLPLLSIVQFSEEHITKDELESFIKKHPGCEVNFKMQKWTDNSSDFESIMHQAADELNKSCPRMVDHEICLDFAEVISANIFQYNHTLPNMKREEVDLQAFDDYMKPMLISMIKTNSDLKTYRDHKITMAYHYKDKYGETISKISINPEDYQN